jgi:hypothetical protein
VPKQLAALGIDATLPDSSKWAAKPTYANLCGSRSSVALWAEQDLTAAEEFRDGGILHSCGNDRAIERASIALSEGIEKIHPSGLGTLQPKFQGQLCPLARPLRTGPKVGMLMKR